MCIRDRIEIYFSIVQRKVLTPNDLQSLNELEQRLLAFQRRYEETASPFQWTFTRKDPLSSNADFCFATAEHLGRVYVSRCQTGPCVFTDIPMFDSGDATRRRSHCAEPTATNGRKRASSRFFAGHNEEIV